MTKTLYLVRHAKSSWADMGMSDFDRPLNKRGLRDAPEMGRRLTQRQIRPDIILCSPAKRTRQTIELLAPNIGATMERVVFNEAIYEASPETLLEIIRSIPDQCNSAMIIGHNPAMAWIANLLSKGHIDHMPTCAIATCAVASDHWKDAGTCPAKLLDFDYPKHIQ